MVVPDSSSSVPACSTPPDETTARKLRESPKFMDTATLASALAYRDVHQALAFLVGWANLQKANQLLLTRAQGVHSVEAADLIRERPFLLVAVRLHFAASASTA